MRLTNKFLELGQRYFFYLFIFFLIQIFASSVLCVYFLKETCIFFNKFIALIIPISKQKKIFVINFFLFLIIYNLDCLHLFGSSVCYIVCPNPSDKILLKASVQFLASPVFTYLSPDNRTSNSKNSNLTKLLSGFK